MPNYKEMVIFGCGGVGSWVANFVTRNNLCEYLKLVDFDTVERKNFKRQDFNRYNLGSSKCQILKEKYSHMSQEDENLTITACERKIVDDIDLESFNPDAVAIICTDNIISKRLIASRFKKFLVVNCDKNFVEIKNHLDKTDNSAWDMGGGYSNEQDIFSNIQAASYVYLLLRDMIHIKDGCRFVYKKRVETQFYDNVNVVITNDE